MQRRGREPCFYTKGSSPLYPQGEQGSQGVVWALSVLFWEVDRLGLGSCSAYFSSMLLVLNVIIVLNKNNQC